MRRRAFLATTGLGAAAMLGASSRDARGGGKPGEEDPRWNATERANVKTVSDFCAAWSNRDMTRVLPFLAEDCVYRMTETAPPASGHDGVIARLKPTVDRSTLVEFRVIDTLAAGPIVMNHRVDRFVSDRPLTWEGVGVFFVKDGKIKEWSDYTIRVAR